ncbi:MAG: hypothetical protein ACK559_23190, partial [bacterium]
MTRRVSAASPGGRSTHSAGMAITVPFEVVMVPGRGPGVAMCSVIRMQCLCEVVVWCRPELFARR